VVPCVSLCYRFSQGDKCTPREGKTIANPKVEGDVCAAKTFPKLPTFTSQKKKSKSKVGETQLFDQICNHDRIFNYFG